MDAESPVAERVQPKDTPRSILAMLVLAAADGRPHALTESYIVEYTSSEHRGIIMYSEPYEARSAIDAMAYAKLRLADVAEKYGARGYRVRGDDGAANISDAIVT